MAQQLTKALNTRTGRTKSMSLASLLCSVSFFALPGSALAVDECGAGADGGTVNCNLVAYATGIDYKGGSAHSNFTVNVGAAAGQASAVTVGNPGIGMGTIGGSHGSQVLRVTGDVTVNTTTNHGLFAASDTGFVNIYTAARVTVTSMGLYHGVHSSVDGNFTSAIDLFSSVQNNNGPAGSVTITGGNGSGLFAFNAANGNSIASAGTGTMISTTGGFGIYSKSVSGSAAASTDGSIMTTGGAAHGIKGYAGGVSLNLSLGQNGSITTQGAGAHGIFADSFNADGAATVIVSGDIDTQGDGSQGVRAVTNGDIYVRVQVGATINGGSGVGAGITVRGGADAMDETRIKIEGLVQARSNFAISGGNAAELVDIELGGTVVGFLDLGLGSDNVNNNGTWIARGSNTDFGAGTDTFNNSNLFVVVGSQSLNGLEDLNNDGMISLLEGDAGMFNSDMGFETLTIGNFAAMAGSEIALDVVLGDDASFKDTIVINGTVSGTTMVTINNLGGLGDVTTTGIMVIDTNMAMGVNINSFVLSGPVSVNGINYTLELGGDNRWYLVSDAVAPPPPVPMAGTVGANFASIGFAGAWMWQQTLEPIEQRSGQLRQMIDPDNQTASVGLEDLAVLPGTNGRNLTQLWARGQGGNLVHDGNSAGSGFQQDFTAFTAGGDIGWQNVMSEGDLLVLGGFAGIQQGTVDMDDSTAEADLHGFLTGIYIAYLRGPLLIDATIKYDILHADLTDPLTLTNTTLDVDTLGVQVSAAYRLNLGSFFVEPNAQLSYAETSAEDFVLGTGGNVVFGDGQALWLEAGVKAGTSFKVDTATLMPYVTLAYQGQFLDDPSVTSGTSTREAGLSGSAIEAGGGISVVGLARNITLDLGGSYLAGEDYNAGEINASVKLAW